jgi:hypothetical protein
MPAYRYVLLLFVFCFSAFFGWGKQSVQSRIYVRTEVHSDKVLLRWIAGDAKSWQLLNKYGFKLERLTVARSGVLLDKPEVLLLAGELKPAASDKLKACVREYPMGAVVAQAVFGDSFEVSLGDSPISKAIALDEERQQRYLFALYAADLCFPVAKEVGWGFEDGSIKDGERYLYRVTSLVPKKELTIAEGASFVVVGDTIRLPQPLELSAQFSPAGAYLSWDYNRLATLYSSYWIERSEDGKTFSRISDLPITRMSDTEKKTHAPITYLDSIAYRKTYYYRVAGVTPFGSQGTYSAVVSGMAYPPLTAIPQIEDSRFDTQGGANLSWNFKQEEEDLIEGFRILRSKDDKTYLPLDSISPKERTYHIRTLARYPYYKVEAKAKQGVSTTSFPTLIQAIDSIPPAVPTGLRAEVDSLGAVHLSWQAGKDEDLYGYRLYRGETKGEELIPITKDAILSTNYIDSVRLDNLNAKVYYALTALDERYNQSELSETIVVRKPACIPPAMPLIVETKASEEGNVIRWEASEDSFLAGFVLTRTVQDSTQQKRSWQIKDAKQRSYVDKEIEAGKTYTYQLTAYTDNQLYSPISPEVKVVSKSTEAKTADVNFTTEVLTEGIALKWRISKQVFISATLYKVDESGKLGLYRENLPQAGEVIDKEVRQGNKNAYMLVVYLKGSRPISIRKEVQL